MPYFPIIPGISVNFVFLMPFLYALFPYFPLTFQVIFHLKYGSSVPYFPISFFFFFWIPEILYHII